jgi:hypothetical protein
LEQISGKANDKIGDISPVIARYDWFGVATDAATRVYEKDDVKVAVADLCLRETSMSETKEN